MTKLPRCMPTKGKYLSEDHILENWDYYVTVTRKENKIFMQEVGKATWNGQEAAKRIGKKGGQKQHTKGKYFEASKKRRPRTPTFNEYVHNA